MLQKTNFSVFVVVASSLLLSWMHCPFFEIFDYDKELFQYMGMAVAKGQVPYRDFFDHKPPLIYFLHALAFLIGKWGLFIISSSLALLASLMFYSLCKRFKLLPPWLLPLFFNLLLRSHVVSLGLGLTREYTTVFLMMFFCTVFSESKIRNYVMGLLFGLIFFMQQDQIILLAPLLIFDLLFSQFGLKTRPLEKYKQFSFGVLMVLLPLLIYFSIHHSLAFLWEDAFIFNIHWYNQVKTPTEQLSFTIKALTDSGFDIPFYSITILSLILFYFSKNKPLLISALLIVLLSPAAHFISGRPIMYHFQPLAAALPILLFILLAFTNLGNKPVYRILESGYVLTMILVLLLCHYRPHISTQNYVWLKNTSEYQYLQQQQLEDGELYVFGDSRYVYLYNQFQILSPSKWLYQHFWFWYPTWDTDHQILNSIINNLQQHQTKYIIDCSERKTEFVQTTHYAIWKKFLLENYTPYMNLSSNTRGTLWKIK
jgi:hypothetical protein